MSVGVRELKNRLSHYLRRVSAGETVRVSDRGLVVAELKPPKKKRTLDDVLDELAVEGAITRGSGVRKDFKPLKLKGKGPSAAAAIVEDRG